MRSTTKRLILRQIEMKDAKEIIVKARHVNLIDTVDVGTALIIP